MSDHMHLTAGITSGTLAAICCGLPLLLVTLGAAGVTISFVQAGYILVPLFLVLAGYYGFRFFRRRSAAQACCDPISPKNDVEVKS